MEAQGAPSHVVSAVGPGDPSGPPYRTGNPVPAEPRAETPAAVVEGSPAPGLVGAPSPPVNGPSPAPVGVGRPVRVYVWPPDAADFGVVGPAAVGIQIVGVGCDLCRKVSATLARIVRDPALAGAVPRGEVISVRAVEALRILRGLPLLGVRSLPGKNVDLAISRVERRASLQHRQARLTRVRIDPVHAASLERYEPSGRLYGQVAALARMDVQPSRVNPERWPGSLGGVLQGALGVHADENTRSQLQLRPSGVVGPHAVAGQKRDIGLGLLRGVFRAVCRVPLERHRRLDVTDPCGRSVGAILSIPRVVPRFGHSRYRQPQHHEDQH